MSDGGLVAGNTVIVAALAAPPPEGRDMCWELAVRYLPSIDTPAIGAWLSRHPRGVVVAPRPDCSPVLLTAVHRELSVPPGEYALFCAALNPGAPWTASRNSG
ncbi:hypothetical protein [Nocardia sp. NPDC048505]|uniref:hypothetical protein n=1 Tax=unclassified Nocardia TaxID=2637762 RepID=UPI0033FF4E1F